MTWQLDPAHSRINFSARHLMVATVRGEFEKFSANFTFDENNFAATTVQVDIDAASLNSREPKRDEHLKSADFLDVANFPTLTFKSTNINVINATHARLGGDLTIRGVTKPVVLDVESAGL